MNTNGKIAQKRYGGRRDVFVISFAIFQTAEHDFYALDKETRYLPSPPRGLPSGPTTERGRLEDKSAWSPPM